jgi:uncharacterized membrane protein
VEVYFAILYTIIITKILQCINDLLTVRRSKHTVLRSAANLIKYFRDNYRFISVWKSKVSKTIPVSIIRDLKSAFMRLIARDRSTLRRHENLTPYGKFCFLFYRSLMSNFAKKFYKINIIFVVYWFYLHKTFREILISHSGHNGRNMQEENVM